MVKWERLSSRVKILTVLKTDFVIWKGYSPLLDNLPKLSYKDWHITKSSVAPYQDKTWPHPAPEGKWKGVVLRKFALSARLSK